ncbi:MAG: HEPN domain-containing protein [Actinomycetota bacterium]
MFEDEEGREDWLDQARFTLLASEDMLMGGLAEEAIYDSFLAMVYAARAALQVRAEDVSGWEEVVSRFQAGALPALGLSKENQRALPIVAGLYRRVSRGEVEADPVTGAACLEDARSFVDEVEARLLA